MAGPLFADRVLEVSTTTSTGTYTLGGAVTGYQTWAGVGNGNTGYYYAEDVDADGIPIGDWEVGLGTYTSSGTTLARTTVLKSTNSNNAVSWAAGTRRIGNNIPAQILAVLFNPPSVSASRTTNQAITTATPTAIAFTAADDWDTDTMHDPSSNNTRITFNTAGVYTLDAYATFATDAAASFASVRIPFFQLNGTTALPGGNPVLLPNSILTTGCVFGTQWKFAAADYIEVMAYHNLGSDLNVANAGVQATRIARG